MRLFASSVKKVEFYQLPEYCPIFNFYKALETGNASWLLHKFDADFKSTQEMEETAIRLFDYYVEKTNNRTVTDFVKKRLYILQTEHVIKIASFILNRIATRDYDPSLLDALVNLRVKTGTDVQKGLQVLAVWNDKLKDLKKELDQDKKSNDFNIDEQAVLISKKLNLGYKIDTKKTSITEWVAIIKIAQNEQ